MASDLKMNEWARMHGSRDVDPGVEQDREVRRDASCPTTIRTNQTTLGALFQIPLSTKPKDPTDSPTTLGALFQIPLSTKPKSDPTDSPTTPLAFVRSPGRHSFNGRTQRSNDLTDSPTTPTTPSALGSPARRSLSTHSQSMNGRAMKLNDSSPNFTTPSAIASPGKTSQYARSQSMNGRIQKPSFGRSQSFNAKYGLQSHHMETLQSKLYNKMRTLGIDHQTVVDRLERLKDLYLNRGDQTTPESPPSSSHQPLFIEDQPTQASTIGLLKYKFAQLERFKESSQGQQIPLSYPPQNYNGGQSSSSGHRTPGSSGSGSPRMAPSSDSSYEFDETTAALLAVQQEMMWNLSGHSTALGNFDVASNSNESIGSLSPNWYSTDGESPLNSGCAASGSDKASNAVALHQKLSLLKVGHQSNLGAFQQDAKIRGAAMGHTTRSGAWGTGTSSTTPLFADQSKEGSAGSEMPETWHYNAPVVQSSSNRAECPSHITMEHQELIDTSLRL